ncbi:MAG: hypothetical protein Q8M31_21630 [Beijerinckiaceae bacterium]|nr:hypothetical protein [Beijerinckiaceae bacterium]
MARFHVIKNAQTGATSQVPFTLEEEAAADAAAAFVPVPQIISSRQFFQQLAVMEAITEAEAEAALAGTIPPAMLSVINTMPNAPDRFSARMLLIGAKEYHRDHPLVSVFAAAMEWSSGQVDDLFRAASVL